MKNKGGFTLVELMVVIVVIGILAGLAIPRFMGVTTKAKLSEFKPVLKQAVTLYKAYYDEHETYVTKTGNISNGNEEIGFDLPEGESRFDYSSAEKSDGVVVIAKLKKDVGKYKQGMGADMNQKFEKNTTVKDIPW